MGRISKRLRGTMAGKEPICRDGDRAELRKEPEEEFVPKPYTGPVSTKGKKRNSAKKKEKKPAEKKTAAQKLASEAPEEEQISFGAFLQDMEKAS